MRASTKDDTFMRFWRSSSSLRAAAATRPFEIPSKNFEISPMDFPAVDWNPEKPCGLWYWTRGGWLVNSFAKGIPLRSCGPYGLRWSAIIYPDLDTKDVQRLPRWQPPRPLRRVP